MQLVQNMIESNVRILIKNVYKIDNDFIEE